MKNKAVSQLVILTLLVAVICVQIYLWKTQKSMPKQKPSQTKEYGNASGEIGEIRAIRLRERNPGRSYIVQPDDYYLSLTDGLKKGQFRVVIDYNGFIGPSEIHEHPDSVIVFLGDSTTECLFMPQDKRFPYVAGRALEAKHGIKLNAYNAGVAGNNALHSLNIFINKIIPMHPDAVVLMHNINDLNVLVEDGSYWNTNAALSPIMLLNDNDLTNAGKREFNPTDMERIPGEFGKMLEMFIDVCRAQGITPVLMTQSSRLVYRPQGIVKEYLERKKELTGIPEKDYVDLFNAMNREITEVGAARGVQVIDVASRIPPDKQYIYDEVHLTQKGAALVSQTLVDELNAETLTH